VIRYQDVHLDFAGKKIFSGFNLEVPENEKLLISGPSGCGKTTLLKILLGFEKITAGRIFCGKVEVTARNIRAVRSEIFYLSQDIDFRNDRVAAVLDEILSFEPNRGVTSGDAHQRNLMQLLELENDILEKNMPQLSGGERQRLGLLVCFILNRPVWLLDEPTSSLDERLRKKVVRYILETGKTVVVISHDDIWRKNGALRIERWS